jgi:hypothetical protein
MRFVFKLRHKAGPTNNNKSRKMFSETIVIVKMMERSLMCHDRQESCKIRDRIEVMFHSKESALNRIRTLHTNNVYTSRKSAETKVDLRSRRHPMG